MDAEMYVSPDGQSRMRVASPETAIRMRARGWKPETEAKFDQGGTLPSGVSTTTARTAEPVRTPAKSDKS